MMFFNICGAILVLLICYIIFKRERRSNVNDFPVPPGRFFFGHIFEFVSAKNVLKKSVEYLRQYGSIVKLFGGPYAVVLLTDDHKFIQFILNSNNGLQKSENYLYLEPWLGSGLLISEGNTWKHDRKMLTPAFHLEILKKYTKVFNSVGNKFLEHLKRFDGDQSVDLQPLASLCTLDMISESAMGVSINDNNSETMDYIKNVKAMTEIITNRSLSFLKLKNFTFVLTSDYYRQRRITKKLHEYVNNIIAQKKKELKKKITVDEKLAFLDLLLTYQEKGDNLLTDKKIREQVDMFMFAGHDTTAAALSFTLYCLATHPKVQEKVLEEQNDLFGSDKNYYISYNDLHNMKYLENVIKESLRLYPPVPLIGRFTTKETQFDDHIIKKNTNLFLAIYSLHRNPKYFTDPDNFLPERFEDFTGNLSSCYLPFGAGSRNCIGQKLAMFELKTIISKVIRHFQLEPASPKHQLDLAAKIVLTSDSGVKVGLKLRK